MSNPDVDHCDRIKEGDDKFDQMNFIVKTQGCSKENDDITNCLKNNRHDWRKCTEIVDQ